MAAVITAHAQEEKVNRFRTESVATKFYNKEKKWTRWQDLPNSKNVLLTFDGVKNNLTVFSPKKMTFYFTTITKDIELEDDNVRLTEFNCIDMDGGEYTGTQIIHNGVYNLYLQQSNFEMRFIFRKI